MSGNPKMSRSAMTLEVAIITETAAVEKTLDEFFITAMKDIQTELPNQMRLLSRDLVLGTPPFKTRDYRHESFAEQRRQGRKAVERDIFRVFQPIENIVKSNSTLGPAIAAALKNPDNPQVGASLPELLVQAGALDKPEWFRVIASPNAALHLSARRRRGRVPSSTKPFYVMNRGAVARYVRNEQRKVGKAKGGWVVGAQAVGLQLPGWITEHRSGTVDDKSEANTNPYITSTNTVSYMRYLNQRLYTTLNALKDRRVSMERQMTAILKKRAAKASR